MPALSPDMLDMSTDFSSVDLSFYFGSSEQELRRNLGNFFVLPLSKAVRTEKSFLGFYLPLIFCWTFCLNQNMLQYWQYLRRQHYDSDTTFRIKSNLKLGLRGIAVLSNHIFLQIPGILIRPLNHFSCYWDVVKKKDTRMCFCFVRRLACMLAVS